VKKIANYKLAVAVMVVNKENNILLVKNYNRGWEFPGGFVGPGETIKDAAIREAKEETGVHIRLTDLIGIEQHVLTSTCVFIFKGEPAGGTLAVSDENQDVRYFPIDKAIKKITLKKFKERIVRSLDKNERPFYITYE
jgi:ADP-ribose pyrophosphatase YjhB (NUDIX family)